MMSGAKKRVPKRRFKEFLNAGDWEQCKLDELTISIGDGLHGTPKYDENGSYYFINGNNLVDSKVSVTAETKKVAFEALSNDDRRLDSTSILMSINGTIGTLARYNNENIMLGKSVAYITPKNINRDFLFYQLQGNVIQSYFYKNLTGTTIKNLGLGTIKNAIVMSTLSEEESKIGQFFYKLDQFITLHQRKLDKLHATKKALLQEMFPEEGQDKPKRRFKGFTDAWEQRKLSEIVTINPKTELPDEFKYVDLESVVGTNLLGFQVIKKENAPSRAQRLASYGDVFYQTVRPYQRNNYLFENVDKDMVFSTGYAQLRSKLDSYFLLTLVQNDNFVKVVLDNCTGTSYPAINGSELGKITVQIPPNEIEANQIGKVFRGIDKSITLHQRKLDKLKNLKQAYLNEMFV